MRVKIFTHTDLDGVTPVILAKKAFDHVDYELCNYGEINDKVREFTASMQWNHYDKIFITDISVNKDVADLIDYSELDENCRGKYQLIDHHSTAEWLNKFHWANVQEIIGEDKTSGTSMFHTYLLENGMIEEDPYIDEFVEKVRRYDSWEWHDKYNDQHAKRLNDLLYIVGQSEFIRRFSDNCNIDFTDGEVLILNIEEKKIDKYIKTKEKQMIITNVDEYKVGVIFAEQYTSELGNELAKKHTELDMIIMIDSGSGRTSYRTAKNEINVAKFAERAGGGGHPKSSGSLFNKDILPNFISEIFNREVK